MHCAEAFYHLQKSFSVSINFNNISAPSQILSAAEESLENDYPIIDEREFRRALDRCYTQSQNANVCKLNVNKIPARNAFETLLKEIGVEICTTGEDEISIYLS